MKIKRFVFLFEFDESNTARPATTLNFISQFSLRMGIVNEMSLLGAVGGCERLINQ